MPSASTRAARSRTGTQVSPRQRPSGFSCHPSARSTTDGETRIASPRITPATGTGVLSSTMVSVRAATISSKPNPRFGASTIWCPRSGRSADGLAAGAERVEHAAAGSTVRGQSDPRLVLGQRLTGARADGAIRFTDVVHAAEEQLLHLLALCARQAAIVGRPGRLDAPSAAQLIREHTDGQRIGLRRVVRVDDVEVLEDEEGRPRGARGDEERGVGRTRKRRAVDPADPE